MAKFIRTDSGILCCSYCGTAVEKEDESCQNCGERLEGEITDGKVCQSCNTVSSRLEDICPNCGAELDLIKPKSEDDEYLSRLLGWSDEAEEKLRSKVEEKKKAVDVFKKMTSAGAVKSEDDDMKDTDELYDTENGIDFDMIFSKIKDRKERVKEELQNVNDDLVVEKYENELDHLKEMEDTASRMEKNVKQTISKQEEEFKLKREELKERIREFKKVVKRRESEKNRINEHKEKLTKKEDELKKWETQLRAWEEDLRDKEEDIRQIKEMYEDGERQLEEIERELPEEGGVTEEEWLDEQKRVQRELFKLKDVWEDDEELEELDGQSLRYFRKKIKEKEEEWKQKMKDLEKELERVREEKEMVMKKELDIDLERDEIGEILTVLDTLLGHLPEEKISEFASSEHFELYEKVLDAFEI